MKCPKCKSDVVEIRGSYYCSSCGEKVNLGDVKEKLEQKMEQARKKAMQEKSSMPTKTFNVETLSEEQMVTPKNQNIDIQDGAKTENVELSKPEPEAQDISKQKIETPLEKAQKPKPKLHISYKLKILLAVVVVLNILIISGIVYLLVIK